MKQKKPTITIGIPAFNEEANIARLIRTVLRFKQTNFHLLEIIVACDGCTDKTVDILKKFHNPRVKIIHGKTRMGQQMRQNHIIKKFSGDILVLIEADTLPANPHGINELVKVILAKSDWNIGMAVGSVKGIRPVNKFQSVVNHGNNMMERMFRSWRGGVNIYTIGGHAMRAIPRSVAIHIKWPAHVPEDAYLYLFLKKHNYEIYKTYKAMTLKKNAANLGDRFKQSTKFVTGRNELNRYFDPEFVAAEYTIPKITLFRHLIVEFFHHPYPTVLYVIQTLVHRAYLLRIPRFSALYVPYNSTKVLYK